MANPPVLLAAWSVKIRFHQPEAAVMAGASACKRDSSGAASMYASFLRYPLYYIIFSSGTQRAGRQTNNGGALQRIPDLI